MLGIGRVILLWHSLGLPYNYFGEAPRRNNNNVNGVLSKNSDRPKHPHSFQDICALTDYLRTLAFSMQPAMTLYWADVHSQPEFFVMCKCYIVDWLDQYLIRKNRAVHIQCKMK